VGTRAELARDTLDLAGDFPFTGGGLAAFPGLFAQYARLTPFFVIIHGHNYLLDVLLEQGVFGLLALAAILIGTVWLLALPAPAARSLEGNGTLRLGVATALVVLLLHGLVEDPLYGSRGTLLLFALPGLAAALGRPERAEAEAAAPARLPAWVWATPLVALALVVALGFWQRQRLQSAWYANLGALEMARVELVGWPTGVWDEGRNVAALAPAEALLERAQQINPDNETAAYYLGLAAMVRRDYPAAVAQLERARQQNGERRGVRKALGYSYAWLGRYEPATPLLVAIPEARQELETYNWWWGTQGREDLAQQATEMRAALRQAPNSAE
jgi:tetratricopeptide (TPR) repeat protein